MAVPKRRTSKTKTAQRRASSYRLKTYSTQVCPHCGAPKLPHHVCGSCGYYDGKQVLTVDEAE